MVDFVVNSRLVFYIPIVGLVSYEHSWCGQCLFGDALCLCGAGVIV